MTEASPAYPGKRSEASGFASEVDRSSMTLNCHCEALFAEAISSLHPVFIEGTICRNTIFLSLLFIISLLSASPILAPIPPGAGLQMSVAFPHPAKVS